MVKHQLKSMFRSGIQSEKRIKIWRGICGGGFRRILRLNGLKMTYWKHRDNFSLKTNSLVEFGTAWPVEKNRFENSKQ